MFQQQALGSARPGCLGGRPVVSRPQQNLRRHPTAARPVQAVNDTGSSRSVLDAFFYGRAFAEVLNERLGAVADDLLVEFNKQDAERRKSVREFFDQVQSRAESQKVQASTSTPETAGRIPPSRQLPSAGGTSGTSNGATAQAVQNPPSPDLQEAVDDLRAEVASARAQIIALRTKQQQKI